MSHLEKLLNCHLRFKFAANFVSFSDDFLVALDESKSETQHDSSSGGHGKILTSLSVACMFVKISSTNGVKTAWTSIVMLQRLNLCNLRRVLETGTDTLGGFWSARTQWRPCSGLRHR